MASGWDILLGTGAQIRVDEAEITASEVRSRIASGAIAAARSMYAKLIGRLGPVTEVLVVEALLHEAEGHLEAALASLERALADAPHSIAAISQLARILVRLERFVEAENAALATLRLEETNFNGLWALAEVHARTGRLEARLDVIHRLALLPGLSVSATWTVVSELSAAGRWPAIIDILDRREARLAPKRVTTERVEAMIHLNRQRDALVCLEAALSQGHVQLNDVVARLIAHGAVALAAAFVERVIESGHGPAGTRALIIATARRTCETTTLEESPFEFADAVRALEILNPGDDAFSEAAGRSTVFLVSRARTGLDDGDASLATETLIHAARLRPHDRAILEMLADSARRAGQAQRHFDTLLRIHQIFSDGPSFAAVIDAAMATANWSVLGDLISKAPPDVRTAAGTTIVRLRHHSYRQLESLLGERNFEAALVLVSDLKPWHGVGDWPGPSIERLLAGAKRHLRTLRPFADAAVMTRVCSLYIAIDSADLDVGRLLARLHLRNRNFTAAAEVLSRLLWIDPHSARDWADLALARQELKQPESCNACVARAIVIAPDIPIAKTLDVVRARLAGACV
ncbi:MAG: tetratricopeptide repeat protein [Pseudomonadota bacterium]|nr:tetratricopeptide repeat protein [Pseudomonadota bacterium]